MRIMYDFFSKHEQESKILILASICIFFNSSVTDLFVNILSLLKSEGMAEEWI